MSIQNCSTDQRVLQQLTALLNVLMFGKITVIQGTTPWVTSGSTGGGGGGGSATSTSDLQNTGNTSLASIDSKTPVLGQALNGASVPVVLTAAQLTALTAGQVPIPTMPLTGQVKVVTTGTAVQFPSNALSEGVVITANLSNVAKVTIGGSSVTNVVTGSGNGAAIEAGNGLPIVVGNTNALYLNGTAGDWISFIGS